MIWSPVVGLRYYLYVHPTDMRKGFDGLSGLVCNKLGQNPSSGDVFIFLNRKRDRIKLLHWEGDGFSIYYKRLEAGTYELPVSKSGDAICLRRDELQLLLAGIQLSSVKRRKRYKKQEK